MYLIGPIIAETLSQKAILSAHWVGPWFGGTSAPGSPPCATSCSAPPGGSPTGDSVFGRSTWRRPGSRALAPGCSRPARLCLSGICSIWKSQSLAWRVGKVVSEPSTCFRFLFECCSIVAGRCWAREIGAADPFSYWFDEDIVRCSADCWAGTGRNNRPPTQTWNRSTDPAASCHPCPASSLVCPATPPSLRAGSTRSSLSGYPTALVLDLAVF